MSAEVVVIAGAVLLGAMVFGVTGYGFAITVTPILIHLMAPAQVVLMAHTLGLIQIAAILLAVHRFVDPRASLSMIGAASTGLAGFPPGLFLLNERWGKHEVRANLATFLLGVSILTVGALLASHTVSVGQLLFTLLFAPVAVLGIMVGNFLANRMSVTLFRQLAILVAGAAGVSSVIAGLAALR